MTVVRTVYETQPQETSAVVEGNPTEVQSEDQKTTSTAENHASQTRDVHSQTSAYAGDRSEPTVISMATVSTAAETALQQATGKPTAHASDVGEATQFASHSASPTETAVSASSSPNQTQAADSNNGSSSGSSSAGAKAGIAFGVLGGLFVMGVIVWLIFSRRKKRVLQDRDDREKMEGPFADVHQHVEPLFHPSDAQPPRLSLRPVTQFFPYWNTDKRASKGDTMFLAPAAAPPARRSAAAEVRDRPSTSQSTHSANPFGNYAERIPSPVAEEHCVRPQSAANPVEQSPFASHSDGFDAAAAAAAALAVESTAAAGLSRKASMRKDGVTRVDLTIPTELQPVPPSPAGTEFSETPLTPGAPPVRTNGAAAIAAAGGPQHSTVHRVQLDFNPTLEDEMELRAGELVRLLHEYDDGWVRRPPERYETLEPDALTKLARLSASAWIGPSRVLCRALACLPSQSNLAPHRAAKDFAVGLLLTPTVRLEGLVDLLDTDR